MLNKSLLRRTSQCKDSGFTLVEVLIALLILAIALTAIVTAVGDNAANLVRLHQTMISHWVGQNVIASEQVGLIPIPEPGQTRSGKMKIHGKDWYWISGIDPSAAKDPYTVRVYVTVSAKPDGPQIRRLIGFIRTKPST